MLSTQEKSEIIALLKAGISVSDISRSFHRSLTTVYRLRGLTDRDFEEQDKTSSLSGEYEKKSTIFTSCKDFSVWEKLFGDYTQEAINRILDKDYLILIKVGENLIR